MIIIGKYLGTGIKVGGAYSIIGSELGYLSSNPEWGC